MFLKPSVNPPETSPELPQIQPKNKNDHEVTQELFSNLETKVFELARVSRISPEKDFYIKQGFKDMFSGICVPNHPPYAWMIQMAIRELNEVGGSSEEDISVFIRKEQKNLPWAHSTLLKHHLGQLCKNGEVVATSGKCYKLTNGILESDPNRSCKPTPSPEKNSERLNKTIQKRPKRKRNLKRSEEDEFDETGEDFKTIDEEAEVTEVENHVTEDQNRRQTRRMAQGWLTKKYKTEVLKRPIQKGRRGRPPKNIPTEMHK